MSADERVVSVLDELSGVYRELSIVYKNENAVLRKTVERLELEVEQLQAQVRELRNRLAEKTKGAEPATTLTYTVDKNGLVGAVKPVVRNPQTMLMWCYVSQEEQVALQKVALTNVQKVREALSLTPLLDTVTSVQPLKGKGKLFQALVTPEERQNFERVIGTRNRGEALRTLLVARFVTCEIPDELVG